METTHTSSLMPAPHTMDCLFDTDFCVTKSYSISVELFSQKISQNQLILAKPNDRNSFPWRQVP